MKQTAAKTSPTHTNKRNQTHQAQTPQGLSLMPPTYGIDLADNPIPLQGKFAAPNIPQTPPKVLQRKEDTSALRTKQHFAKGSAMSSVGVTSHIQGFAQQKYGVDLSSVKITENSPLPIQLNARATIQGDHIHVAPGEGASTRNHEIGHAIHNKMYGTPSTTASLGGIAINNDARLESSADRIGRELSSVPMQSSFESSGDGGTGTVSQSVSSGTPVQRLVAFAHGYLPKLLPTVKDLADQWISWGGHKNPSFDRVVRGDEDTTRWGSESYWNGRTKEEIEKETGNTSTAIDEAKMDERIMDRLGDRNAMYFDGSASPTAGASVRMQRGRVAAGYLHREIKEKRVSYAPDEPITIVGHSMGAAFAAGMGQKLLEIRAEEGIDYRLDAIYYLAPHQPGDIVHPQGIRGVQYSIKNDWVSSDQSTLIAIPSSSTLAPIQGITEYIVGEYTTKKDNEDLSSLRQIKDDTGNIIRTEGYHRMKVADIPSRGGHHVQNFAHMFDFRGLGEVKRPGENADFLNFDLRENTKEKNKQKEKKFSFKELQNSSRYSSPIWFYDKPVTSKDNKLEFQEKLLEILKEASIVANYPSLKLKLYIQASYDENKMEPGKLNALLLKRKKFVETLLHSYGNELQVKFSHGTKKDKNSKEREMYRFNFNPKLIEIILNKKGKFSFKNDQLKDKTKEMAPFLVAELSTAEVAIPEKSAFDSNELVDVEALLDQWATKTKNNGIKRKISDAKTILKKEGKKTFDTLSETSETKLLHKLWYLFNFFEFGGRLKDHDLLILLRRAAFLTLTEPNRVVKARNELKDISDVDVPPMISKSGKRSTSVLAIASYLSQNLKDKNFKGKVLHNTDVDRKGLGGIRGYSLFNLGTEAEKRFVRFKELPGMSNAAVLDDNIARHYSNDDGSGYYEQLFPIFLESDKLMAREVLKFIRKGKLSREFEKASDTVAALTLTMFGVDVRRSKATIADASMVLNSIIRGQLTWKKALGRRKEFSMAGKDAVTASRRITAELNRDHKAKLKEEVGTTNPERNGQFFPPRKRSRQEFEESVSSRIEKIKGTQVRLTKKWLARYIVPLSRYFKDKGITKPKEKREYIRMFLRDKVVSFLSDSKSDKL
ncbi:MAG TPA: hypothetical protein DCS93_36630 [Microscillaceae bacterium]|nr:hypothetical protein [Microscillaceae bacterium]